MAGNNLTHAFRYTGTPGSGGVMHDLGTLGGDAPALQRTSEGKAINASGQVAGYSITAGAKNHAFRYTGTPGSGGAMTDLGTLGGEYSYAYAINDSGQVAGSSWMADNSIHAFLYTGTPGSGGTMADLGTLGGRSSDGRAINASGQVAGYSNTTDEGASHAFLYTGTPGVDGLMIDLDAWLDATNPTEGAKWTLLFANGLNDGGLIIGEGLYDDGLGGLSRRAFILDASSVVPEPGGLALLGVAVPVLLRRRARRT